MAPSAFHRRLKAAQAKRTGAGPTKNVVDANGTVASVERVVAVEPTTALNDDELETDANLTLAITAMDEDGKPINTAKAMDSKREEWHQFCDFAYPKEGLRCLITAPRAWKFMLYQMFREQKPKGGDRASLKALKFFDEKKHKETMAEFVFSGGQVEKHPTPAKPVGSSSFTTYRAVLKGLFHEQQARHQLGSSWEHVWQPRFKKLQDRVKLRKPMLAKANYEEKVDGAFAPHAAVEKFDEIEESLWQCDHGGLRSLCSNLRHRFCCLYLTSGILRCESGCLAELSDFQGITVTRSEKDIHPIYIMIMQIPIGKTNKGAIRCGRAMRHKKVEKCCIGAMSMYLMSRFQYTKEFADFTLEDWLDNKKWFDIKLLIDVCTSDRTNKMQNDTYGDKAKEVLRGLGLSCSKLLHFGRNLGAKILDLLEEFKEEKKQMGQWSPDVVDNSYSSKLPMIPMRKLAGFTSKDGMYCNPRTQIDPPEALLRDTPMGRWCYDAFDQVVPVAMAQEGNKHQTAVQVLKFFCYLNVIFLQDAAEMLIKHPDRLNHPMCKEIPVLRSVAFNTFKEEMRIKLENEQSPFDKTLQDCLPSLYQFNQSVYNKLGVVSQEMRTLSVNVNNSVLTAEENIRKLQRESDKRMAEMFRKMAECYDNDDDNNKMEDLLQSLPQLPTITQDAMDCTTTTTTTATTNTTTNSTDAGGHGLGPNVSITMEARHKTLTNMWNEWHGLEEHADEYGGIKGREAKWKTKWRKGCVNPQHFSRTKKVIEGIQTYARKHGVAIGEAMAALSPDWEDEDKCDRSLSTFVKALKLSGLVVERAPRYKKAKQQAPQQSQQLEPQSADPVAAI